MRCVVVLLTEVRWTPPGIDAGGWRRALAEDVVDLVASLAEVETAIAATAADRALAEALRWPGTSLFPVSAARPVPAFAAAGAAGYDQAAVLPADVPDLPAMLVGKLLRPLGSRAVAVAPAPDGGLVGLAARLPAPDWLAAADPDLDRTTVADLRAAARDGSATADLGTGSGWHRLRAPADLARLDEGLDGWERTRALLSGRA